MVADNHKDLATEPSGELTSGVFSRYGRLLAHAIGRLVRPQDVEDIVQETYMRVFTAAKKHPIRSPRAFMLKTARNVVLDRMARADALNHVALPVQHEGGEEVEELFDRFADEQTPDAVLESEQEFVVLCRAIRALPRQCRRVFLLKKVYGLTQREIAARLGVSEGTVEKHIHKAMIECVIHMESSGFAIRHERHAAAKSRLAP